MWAACYDTQPNPLLMLEERYLKHLLPEIAGRDVLDAGCGSGRWLSYIAERHPQSLKGVDTSEEMLAVAGSKGTPAELVNGSCDQTPFSSKSFDLILVSFILGYIDDSTRLAVELSRIAKDDCDLFLSDMHPDTERLLGWKRSFTSNHVADAAAWFSGDRTRIQRCRVDTTSSLAARIWYPGARSVCRHGPLGSFSRGGRQACDLYFSSSQSCG
jgi:ubiquinone/menaquinone biosynthesis C-methylase UbiE